MKAKVSRGAGFKGLLRYMFDEKNHEHSLKDPEIVSSNMASRDVDGLATEFGLVRRLRADIGKPVFHTSLALPAGEKISEQKWDEIVRDYLVEMGLGPANHQYVAVIHRDTAHQHVHIAANRIGLDGKVWLGQWEAKRAIAATQMLEQKHGLRLTKGMDDAKVDRALSDGEFEKAKKLGQDPDRVRLAALIREARDSAPDFRSFVDALGARGVALAPNGQTGAVSGVSFKYQGVVYAGGKVAKDLKWKELAAAVRFDAVADADLVARLRSARDQDIELQGDVVAKARERVVLEELVDSANADLFEIRSVVDERQIGHVAQLLRRHAPAHAEAVMARLRDELVPLGLHRGQQVYSSQAVLRREQRLIRNAQLLAGDKHHDLAPTQQDEAILAKEREASAQQQRVVTMSEEQRAAVRWALRHGLSNVQGSAGAGKSFSAAAIRLAYEEQGYRVIGVAVARRAAANLKDEAGIESFTIAKLLNDVRGKRLVLDKKTVIVVDEAGQVGAGYADEILRVAAAAGAKVVFTGEDRQTDAIQHGGVLRFLSREEVVGTARVQTIMRQREAWARQAIEALRDGRMDEGLRAFEERDLVHWIDGGSDAVRARLIAAWREYEVGHPDKQALIVTHTNADARALAARVREVRKEEGRVSGPEYQIPAQHGGKAFMLTLAQGDRVRFGLNAEDSVGVINGTMGTVLSIKPVAVPDGQPDYELRVQTDDRGVIQLRTSEYSDEKGRALINQGYVSSIYSAQGLTVDGEVFALQTPGMDRALTYVAASRAKDSTHFFVDQAAFAALADSDDPAKMRAALVATAGADDAEPLATEVLAENDPDYWTRTHGAGIEADARAARDAEMAQAEDEGDEEPIDSLQAARDWADEQLWSLDSVITKDRFEETMIDLEERAPQFADAVRSELEPQLNQVGFDEGGRALCTTDAMLEREVRMVRDLKTLAADRHHDLSEADVAAAVFAKEARTGIELLEGQIAGVRHTLKGGFASLQGSAGAGKSTSMDAVAIAYKDAGYKVYGAAVSKRAATNLEHEAHIESRTIAKTLRMLQRGKLQLDHRSVLVIDEAGQVGTGYLAEIAKHARMSGAKLVFTGEDRQLDAIAHGGVLRFLSRDDVVGTARVQKIFRQNDEWAQQAVEAFRDGKVEAGLSALEDHGLVHWVRGGSDETQERLIKYWRDYERENPGKPSIILAHSNAMARELGERVRAIRREEGRITGPDFKLKAVHGENAYDLTVAQGDRVRFTMNREEGGLDVANGTLGTVTQIRQVVLPDGRNDYELKIATDDRGEVSFMASQYSDEKGRIYLGQANTSSIYAAQGLTIRGKAFVMQSEMMDRANTYVAVSRATEDTHVFIDRDLAAAGAGTDDQVVLRERLVQAMGRERRKSMALEVVADQDAERFQGLMAGTAVVEDGRSEHFAQVIAAEREAAQVRERFAAEEQAQHEAVANTPDAIETRERFRRQAELDALPRPPQSDGRRAGREDLHRPAAPRPR